jgi:hypothetical protein
MLLQFSSVFIRLDLGTSVALQMSKVVQAVLCILPGTLKQIFSACYDSDINCSAHAWKAKHGGCCVHFASNLVITRLRLKGVFISTFRHFSVVLYFRRGPG